MIGDEHIQLIALFPASGLYSNGTFGIDLNPDFGSGPSAVTAEQRRGTLPGMGDDMLFRVRVASAFAIGAGEPVAQFHAVLSEVGDGVAVSGGSNVISIGVAASSRVNVSSVTYSGMAVADLTLNSQFFIRFNPWTAGMGRDAVGGTVIGKNLRYLGVNIVVPNYLGGTHAFSAGLIDVVLVKSSDVMQDPTDFAYPPGTVMVG